MITPSHQRYFFHAIAWVCLAGIIKPGQYLATNLMEYPAWTKAVSHSTGSIIGMIGLLAAIPLTPLLWLSATLNEYLNASYALGYYLPLMVLLCLIASRKDAATLPFAKLGITLIILLLMQLFFEFSDQIEMNKVQAGTARISSTAGIGIMIYYSFATVIAYPLASMLVAFYNDLKKEKI